MRAYPNGSLAELVVNAISEPTMLQHPAWTISTMDPYPSTERVVVSFASGTRDEHDRLLRELCSRACADAHFNDVTQLPQHATDYPTKLRALIFERERSTAQPATRVQEPSIEAKYREALRAIAYMRVGNGTNYPELCALLMSIAQITLDDAQ